MGIAVQGTLTGTLGRFGQWGGARGRDRPVGCCGGRQQRHAWRLDGGRPAPCQAASQSLGGRQAAFLVLLSLAWPSMPSIKESPIRPLRLPSSSSSTRHGCRRYRLSFDFRVQFPATSFFSLSLQTSRLCLCGSGIRATTSVHKPVNLLPNSRLLLSRPPTLSARSLPSSDTQHHTPFLADSPTSLVSDGPP